MLSVVPMNDNTAAKKNIVNKHQDINWVGLISASYWFEYNYPTTTATKNL